jgi:hypothetical protein
MKGALMLATLEKLGIKKSFSRPGVSDDNPFSEALFKTLKYCAQYPDRGFAAIADAQIWVSQFAEAYNEKNLHSGINWVTPSQRHSGADIAILTQRDKVYAAAQQAKPNRWSKRTRNWFQVGDVHLNNPTAGKKNHSQPQPKTSS